jgi:hypothetical protein
MDALMGTPGRDASGSSAPTDMVAAPPTSR